MKTINLNLFLWLITVFITLTANSQIVTFNYDDAGNRVLREVIYLQPTTVIDSSEVKQIVEHEEMLGETKLTISPNPNGGKFTVKIEGYDLESPLQLFLHSINGTMAYKNQNMKMLNEIDISNRQNGTYILSLIIGDTKKTWKIIKQ